MRAASALTVAVGLGVALSLLSTSGALRASGIVGGLYGIVLLVTASVYVGWLASQLNSRPLSLVIAPALVLSMMAVLLGAKQLRWPSAPLVGDGFEIVLAGYGAAGTLGALLGLAPWLRVPASVAARTGLWLTAGALVVSAATFGLDVAISS